VNNAGINIRKTIEEMETAELDEMLAVNVRDPSSYQARDTAYATARRRLHRQHIIGMRTCRTQVHERGLHDDQGGADTSDKIGRGQICKGQYPMQFRAPEHGRNPFVQSLFKDPERKKERLDEVPLGRLASAEDVAEAVVFLVSPDRHL
jgi:NAD(P)-dependent dehydrogenase (short-subunit alcohol dehydrogenase family)